MEPVTNPEIQARFQTMFELYGWGVAIMRQNLRRRFASAGEGEIEGRLVAWLQKRDYEEGEVAVPSAIPGSASSRLGRALVCLDADLSSAEAPWALVGGLAAAVRGQPEMRGEVQAVVAIPEFDRRKTLLRFLRSRNYSERSSGAGESLIAHLISPCREDREITVDLLFVASGIESEIVAGAGRLEVVPGAFVPVARTGHLLAMSLATGRAGDRYAAQVLAEFAEREDFNLCRSTLDLVRERGTHVRWDLESVAFGQTGGQSPLVRTGAVPHP